jgi:flagellar biosynthesis/type III secretory pathway protein FliH
MGLQHEEGFDDPETILAGPYHPAFGHLVYSEIFFDRVRKFITSNKMQGVTCDIRVHPKDDSRMRGLKNENIRKLNQLAHLKSVRITPDSRIAKNKLMVNGRLVSISS